MTKKYKNSDYLYTGILVLILVGLMIGMSFASPYFLSWKNFRNILNQSAIYLIISVGMTFMIASGQIDLSVGAVIGFVGMVMGTMMRYGMAPAVTIVLGLLIGMAVGGVNGCLVAYGRINSFITTLSAMVILRGVTLIATNSKSIFGFGPAFEFIGTGHVGPVNMPIIISLVISILGAILLRWTRFGTYCLFLGSNESALNRAGVNTKKYTVLVFILCSFCAGVSGMIITARLNSAEPLAGLGYEMDAIAATILGGTSMQGGKGRIIGTIIACLILNVLKNGLTLLSISSHYQEIVTGIILILAVLISEGKERKQSEV